MAQHSKQKLIVITGVSKGLGLALTHGFVKAGHRVAGIARSGDAITSLASQYPMPHRFDVVDQSVTTQISDWAGSLTETHGAPDLLINNAAMINANAPLWEVPDDEFSQLIDINIKGVFQVCKAFLPSMIERGEGVIVNLSSGWGRSVSPDVAPYCASKWAIEGLTRALATELPDGLAAVPLNPGVINTEMLQSCFGESAGDYGTATQWASTAVPFLLQLNASNNGDILTAP